MTNGRKWVTAGKEVFSFFSAYRRTVEWARRASRAYLCFSVRPGPAGWTDWLTEFPFLEPAPHKHWDRRPRLYQHCWCYFPSTSTFHSIITRNTFIEIQLCCQPPPEEWLKMHLLKNRLLQITVLQNQETEKCECANESGALHHKCRSRLKHSGNTMIHSWRNIPAEHPAQLHPSECNNVQKTKLWSQSHFKFTPRIVSSTLPPPPPPPPPSSLSCTPDAAACESRYPELYLIPVLSAREDGPASIWSMTACGWLKEARHVETCWLCLPSLKL